MAVVPQRPFLFSDAIAANVALEASPDDAHIRSAVEMAALEPDLESLPDGLETVVGERGIMLSGGQRQRVALARGLYRGGDLLILDDVLSAVDHHTEAQLVETVARSGAAAGGADGPDLEPSTCRPCATATRCWSSTVVDWSTAVLTPS